MSIDIYHNPRCSKSRQTLALIEAAGISPNIIRYLETPLSVDDIVALKDKLGVASVRDFMRTGESDYKALGLKQETDESALAQAMADTPKLIERPIVVKGDKAVLGRPPENVKTLL